MIPHSLIVCLGVLLIGLVALVVYRYFHNEKAIDRGEYTVIPNPSHHGYQANYHLHGKHHDATSSGHDLEMRTIRQKHSVGTSSYQQS